MKKLVIVFSIILLIVPNVHSQKKDKYLKKLSKVDRKYNEGDYETAIKHLEKKFYRKVTKKEGMENKYIPMYFLRKAKYNWALGVVIGFEEYLKNALESSKTFHGATSAEHARTQLEVAENYILYGNFAKALKMLDEVEKTFGRSGLDDKAFEARINLTKIEILTGQGYYNESLAKIEEYIDFFKGRATEKESYIDEDGNLQTRKVPDDELLNRFNNYATILTLKARVLGEMGNIDDGWLAYEKARDWIDDERYLGNKSMVYIKNQFYFANFKLANGLNPDDLMNARLHKDENYLRILTNLKRGHEESHYMAFDIYNELIKQYLLANQLSRYRSFSSEYEKAIKKNFPKNSLNFINLATVEFNSRLTRERTNNLEDRALSILSNIQSLPDLHRKRIDVLDFLHRINIKNRNFDDAEKYLTDIIAIEEGLYGKDAPKVHMSKIKLANFYIDYTDKISEADEIYQKSYFDVVKIQTTPLHIDYISVLNHLAKMEEYHDNYSKSREYLDEAVKVSLERYRDPMDIEYGKELEKVASLQISIGDYQGARENIDKVFEIYDDKKLDKDEYNAIHYVMALETEARLLGVEGYFDKAEDNIDEARDLLFSVKTLEGYNEYAADDQLAELYIYLGRYNETSEGLKKLIREYEKIYGKESGKLANALINKGRLEMLLGNYTEAEAAITRATNIAEKVHGEESTSYSSAKLLMGELYTNIGDYERAIDLIETSVRIEEKIFGRDHIRVALALSQLGLSKFYDSKSIEEAEKILLEARHIIAGKLTNQNPRYADVSTNLAKVYISEGKPNDAIASLSVAESIWLGITGRRGTKNNVNVGKINALVGDVYYSTRDYKRAEEYYDKARKNFERTLNEQHPEYVKILSKLSKVYYMDGDGKKSMRTMEVAIARYEEFIKKYFKTLSEREKAKFWNTIRPDFEFYNTLALEYPDKNSIGKIYNNALLTKALLLNSSIKIRERILGSGDEVLIEKYNEWLVKKDNMTRILSLSEEEMILNNINISKINAEIEDLEKELSTKSDLFGSELEESHITWENVRDALKENEVAIEMIRFRHFNHNFTDSVIYAALYVKNEKSLKEPEVILLKNGYELETRLFKSYRNSIVYKVRDPYSYSAYWEPLVSKIGNLSTIYLSPDGVYNQINLEAIPVDDDKYVIDNSNIILVSNTKDIYLKTQKERTASSGENFALMFGNPSYYLEASIGEISPLPGTELEVKQLRKLLNDGGITSDYFTQDEATEEQIKNLQSPNILHIATHGFFTPEIQENNDMTLNESEAAKNPLMRTGLIMTGGGDLLSKTTFNYNMENGILTAYEAMNLNLDQTDLVVLSACETGLGKLEFGEGVYGLQRAFLVAGAKTLIMSMFKVDDEATQKLMVKFYKKWLETDNKRQAFIDAKKELRVEYKDPIYWGAFIMMGLD